MWHPGGRNMALSDPGKLCHAVIIPSFFVGSQSAHRSGDNHHGDRMSGLRGSCQRKPPSAAGGELLPLNGCWLYTLGHIEVMMTFSICVLLLVVVTNIVTNFV